MAETAELSRRRLRPSSPDVVGGAAAAVAAAGGGEKDPAAAAGGGGQAAAEQEEGRCWRRSLSAGTGTRPLAPLPPARAAAL